MRLVIDISAHGFGHLAQISPVLREIRRRKPSVNFMIRTALPQKIVREFLGEPCGFAPPPPDVGLIMHGPHSVDIERSATAYHRLHSDFAAVMEQQAGLIADLNADLLVSDVGYAGLAGAALAGLPSIALCSFHWGEAVTAYLDGEPDMDRINEEILAAYSSASVFLLAAPRKSLAGINNVHPIGPLARLWGNVGKAALRKRLDLPTNARIGLVAFGGMDFGYPELIIPQQADWFWLLPDAMLEGKQRADLIPQSRLAEMTFLDVMVSSDLVLTKTGYGTFLECASFGIPCLFLSRPRWPETIEVEGWMVKNGFGRALSEQQMALGNWFEANLDLIDSCQVERLRPTGHLNAADYLLSQLI